MTKLALNKSSLKKEKDNLDLYQQYLPSLDLKRQQFLFELKKAREAVAATENKILNIEKQDQTWMPFLADRELRLARPITVEKTHLGEENLLGIKLPVLIRVEMRINDYSFTDSPIWYDAFVKSLKDTINLRLRLQVQKRRLRLLRQALQTITQRVNLFDKVLIPASRKNIGEIKLALAELERGAVIRSKLAKSKKGQ